MTNWISRIAGWMGMDAQSAPSPEIDALRAALDEARRAKRAEDYEGAVRGFERAAAIAQKFKDDKALSIINLHRADLFIRREDWDAAESLLRQLEQEAYTANNRVQLAYVQASLGTLAQAREDWVTARQWYEKAHKTARNAHAPGPEGRAMGHLADTYLHEDNASYALHLLRDALPKLDSSGDVELSSYFVGRLGQAEIAIGHMQEGKTLLSRALRLAEQMQYRRYQRLWHLTIAQLAAQEGAYAESYQHYDAALKMMPANAPEAEAALREMAYVCLHVGRVDEAVTYADRAYLLDPDDPQIQGALGMALRASGRSREAIPFLESAARDGEPLDILRALAAAHDDLHDEQAAYSTYQHALSLARTRHDMLEEARALRDMGLHHARHQHHADAIKSFSESLELYDKLGNTTQAARLHCDIANLRTYLGQNARAMKDYEQALMRLGTSNDLETRGIVLSNAAPAYVDKGDLETAEAFMTESIQIAQKLHDYAAEATRQGNYGWYLLVTGRIKRAVGALEYALQQSSKLNLTLVMAVQNMNLGQAYAEFGEVPKGEKHIRQGLALAESLHNAYWASLIRTTLAAHLLKFGGSPEEAEALVQHALIDAQTANSIEATLRANVVQTRLLIQRGALDEALDLGHEVIASARKVGTRRLIGEGLAVTSEAHAKRGERAQAVALWEEAKRTLTPLHHPLSHLTPDWLG